MLLSIIFLNPTVSGNYGWTYSLQTSQPPTQGEKYQCRIDTLNSPDDGHIVARNIFRS